MKRVKLECIKSISHAGKKRRMLAKMAISKLAMEKINELKATK